MFDFYKLMNKYSSVAEGGGENDTPSEDTPVDTSANETTNGASTQIEDIIAYVMHTPGNTNPSVLRSMLENIGGGEKYGFKVTIINNTNDDITYRGYILFEDRFDNNHTYELLPKSTESF